MVKYYIKCKGHSPGIVKMAEFRCFEKLFTHFSKHLNSDLRENYGDSQTEAKTDFTTVILRMCFKLHAK